jgi:hypothetical protein
MFNINSGEIESGVLYVVYGGQNVTYNGIVYETGQQFRGINGVANFDFSGSGTQLVYEVAELRGAALLFDQNALDEPVFAEQAIFNGGAIEFDQTENDKIVNETTIAQGFAIELKVDPGYSFMINETRL